MKKPLLTISLGLLWLFAAALDPITAGSMMHQGNDAYGKQEFEKALQFYTEVESEFSSAALFLNIGNTYYRMHNVPMAIVYFERAKRLAPNDKDIEFNLEKANNQIVDKLDVNPNQAVDEWLSNLFFGRSEGFWSWASILLITLAVIAFATYTLLQREGTKKFAFYAGSFFAVICAASLVLGSIQDEKQANSGAAIIIAPKADVRTAPIENSGVAFILHEGTKVELLNENDEWLEITIAGGNIGWIPRADLVVI